MITETDLKRELEHEEQALKRGYDQYMQYVQRAKQTQMENTLDYGASLEAREITKLAAAIREFCEVGLQKPGRRQEAVIPLSLVEPEVSAFITARTVIQGLSSERIMQTTAIEIGHRVEDEIRFAAFARAADPLVMEDQRPTKGRLYKGVISNLKKHPSGNQRQTRRSMLNHTIKKFKIPVPGEWNDRFRGLVGSKLLDLFIEACGLVERRLIRRRRKTVWVINATQELTEWMVDMTQGSAIFSPFNVPTVVPPREWKSSKGGGYYHERMSHSLVKFRSKNVAKEFDLREMSTFYNAVNALQNTAWKVNKPILTMMYQVWNSGLEVRGLPARTDPPLPAKPDYLSQPEQWKEWKHKVRRMWHEAMSNQSKRAQAKQVFDVADRLKDEPQIYFPVQCDFRGRIYFLPQALNPQGCDQAKALLTFAEGKPLGPNGVRWLCVHLANSYGIDKVPFEERIAWVYTNHDRICRSVADPMGDLWWTEADKPWQFLAAAIEWDAYCKHGSDNYVCSLPIMVDGTCNGLQHFSAMLRDEVCGAYVNLVPQERPADIYQRVADVVTETLTIHSQGGETDENIKKRWPACQSFADLWLALGIDRDMVKRPVMVLPYNGTRDAVLKYLRDSTRERLGGNDQFFGKQFLRATAYLAYVVWADMQRVVVGPMRAMAWLRECSKILSSDDLPICWTAPSGFLVQQIYRNTTSEKVSTRIGESRVVWSYRRESGGQQKKKHTQALAPNFVHALDAAALCHTLRWAIHNGVSSFAAVHDSYGTLAADVGMLQTCIRASFEEMYRSDVLAEWLDDVRGCLHDISEFPSPPAKGSLDLAALKDSQFFFA